MIVCNVFALLAVSTQLQRIYFTTTTSVAFIVMAIISFPIVGIVADTCVGRFKLIQASMAFLTVSSLLNILLLSLQDYLSTTAETICVLCTTGLCCIGTSCYVACGFPFLADQLIGASGEQLSFAVYWMMWGGVIAYHAILLKSIPTDYFDIVAEAVSFLCIFCDGFHFY